MEYNDEENSFKVKTIKTGVIVETFTIMSQIHHPTEQYEKAYRLCRYLNYPEIDYNHPMGLPR